MSKEIATCQDTGAMKRTFNTADTLANEVYAFDYNPRDASLANQRMFFVGYPMGLPDGSTLDAEGTL